VGPLEVGKKVKGVVTGIRPFGAFVDIGAGTDGLLHITQIAPERVEDIDSYLAVGQELDDLWVRALRGEGKIELTRVAENARPRPSQDLGPFAAEDSATWHSGVVKKVMPYGAIVEVTLSGSGATGEGLVHVSQIRDAFVQNAQDEFEVGQDVQVRVLSADGKLSLSMREQDVHEPPPQVDLTPFEAVGKDQWLDGTVVSTARFGAFVKVAPPGSEELAQGLVHITQISDDYVENVADAISAGDDVKVRVVSVDPESGKLSLSMRFEQESSPGQGGEEGDGF